MRHDVQVGLIRRILDHMEAGTTDRGEAATSPVARYLSPERVEREKKLLRRMPAMVCASSQVARPGDWLAHDLSGLPILVARGQDGVLRAFINACRHRGARLVEATTGRRISRRAARGGAISSARITPGPTTSTAACAACRMHWSFRTWTAPRITWWRCRWPRRRGWCG